MGPVQTFFTKISTNVLKVKDDYIALWAVREENKRLHAILNEYHDKLSEYREAYSTYLRLSEKMKFKERQVR